MIETLEFTRQQLYSNEQFLDALRCTLIDEDKTTPLLINGLLIATDMRILFVSKAETMKVILELSYDEILDVKKGILSSDSSLLLTTTTGIHHFIQIISTNLDYFLQMIHSKRG